MRWLRKRLDRLAPYFIMGKFQRFQPVYRMVDEFLYSPALVTHSAPHVRDGIDYKRIMAIITVAVIPCVIAGMWNLGYQANSAMLEYIIDDAPGWRGVILKQLAVTYDPDNLWDNLCHGMVYILPAFLVVYIVGLFWEILFAVVRKRELTEGILPVSLLFILTLPPTIPLWQAAVGISFGVVIGKEVFGGTGKNFVNPVLVGRAFLYFAYPAQMAGDTVWTAVDGFSGATPLGLASAGGINNILDNGFSWWDAFLGLIQGSMGGTSALACLLGGIILVITGIASWRVIAGVVIGMVISAMIFNQVGSETNAMVTIPWYWHLVLGGFAFGTIFLATDPVTSACTDSGRWIYGLLIGLLIVVIRISNPTIPECTMFAILLGNILAPLIDYVVVQFNIRRRKLHYGRQ